MTTWALSQETRSYISRLLLLTMATSIAAWIGITLLPPGTGSALVWPPAAIGIAALFFFGFDLWPAILISICTVLFLRSGNLPLSIAVSLSDTLESLMGAYFLKQYVRFNPLINTLRDGFGIIAASIFPSLVSAGLIAVFSHYLAATPAAGIQTTWTLVWVGHAVTCLSLLPFLMRWIHRPLFTKTWREIAEGVCIFGSITVISYLLFWTTHGSVGSISLVYVLIFPLFWAALRAGPRGTTLALLILSALGITGIFYGYGPLATTHNAQQVFLIQVLLGVLDIIFILFVAIVEERKDVTNSLAASVNQLEEAIEKIRGEDQAKTNFLAILAHELRNPLAPIVSSVELLKSEAQTPAQAELIDTIESHTHTVSLLLNDLLDITRITHNKFELRREQVTIQQVLKRSIEVVQTLVTSREHELRLDIQQTECWLHADPVRLEQIFVNLLNNAAKYTDAGGVITLTCRQQDSHIVVTVADNGIGMAPGKIGSIFDLFSQIRDDARGSGGLGVGLSLTKRLVEQHRGTIEARSQGLGSGSTFTVRLPLARATEQSSAAKGSGIMNALQRKKDADQKTGSLRVLVVDDNEPAAKALSKLLERGGHSVAVAYDGMSALLMAKDFNPEVVILDIGLPDMSGYDVGKKMREDAGESGTPLRIIAVSGYGQEEHRAKTREAGFNAHLVKPVGIADVEAALR